MDQITWLDVATESTGSHFLDSGGAYGRHWERNKVRFADADPTTFPAGVNAVRVDLYATKDYKWEGNKQIDLGTKTIDVCLSYNTVCWLDECSTINQPLTQGLRHYIGTHEDLDESDAIHKWLDAVCEPGCDRIHDNTYNSENLLSQDLIIHAGEVCQNGAHNLGQIAVVMLHQGCDVRGGYGSPIVVEPKEDVYDLWGPRTVVCAPEYVAAVEPDPMLPGMDAVPVTPVQGPQWYCDLGSSTWRDESWPRRESVLDLEQYDVADYDDLDDDEKAKWDSGYVNAGYIVLCYDTDDAGKVTGKYARCPVTGRRLTFWAF